jgi:carbon-monoxide dehydrogenase medium subunit
MSLQFVQPESISEALAALAKYGEEAKLIAGGTALVLMLQQRLIAPDVLISLGRVPDLDYIRAGEDGPPRPEPRWVPGLGCSLPSGPRGGGTPAGQAYAGTVYLGPLALLRQVERSPLVQEKYPALARACGVVGNVRIRNQATLGGNLAEADYASDPPAMLLALDASVTATGPRGSRAIPLSDFFLGFYTTALQPDELITGISIPALSSSTRMTYVKFKSRSSEDRPCLGVAVVAEFEGEICTDLRVAVGAACEVPRRLPEVEALARSQMLTHEVIAEVAEGYAANIETLEDLRGSAWYRTQMIRVHVRRALEEVRDGRR